MYMEKPFHIFTYDEYLNFVVDFIERLSPEIVLQRLFATAPDNILIAPRWDRNRYEILRDIERRLGERDTSQGKKYRVAVPATG
jgi:radical SAM superfamily enzyme